MGIVSIPGLSLFASMHFLSNYFFEYALTAHEDSLANSTAMFLLPVLPRKRLVSQSPEVRQVPAQGVN